MSSIRYKFSASSREKTVVFNGISISLSELKREVMEKEGLKPTEVDLSVKNAQTNETYKNEQEMISKNTSVIVQRTPLSRKHQSQTSQAYTIKKTQSATLTGAELQNVSELYSANATEEDKIEAMMKQGVLGYDQYHKKGGRYSKPTTPAPAYLRCYKCQGQGHYPSNCSMPKNKEPMARPPTGIPRSKLQFASKETKGAKLCPDGTYMVVSTETEAYRNPKKEKPPFVPQERKEESDDEVIPDELTCGICDELVREPVRTPCCDRSFCRECITKDLLDQSDDQKCLKCNKPLTPYQLIEDKTMKQEAILFKNSRGKTSRQKTEHVAPKKVSYGSSATQYGSVFGNGKVEMNKTAGYIVKHPGTIIKTEDDIKREFDSSSVSLPPPIMPPKIPNVAPLGQGSLPPPNMGIPPPGVPPPNVPPPSMPPNMPPQPIPPNTSLPPPSLPPPPGVPMPNVPPPTSTPSGAPPPIPSNATSNPAQSSQPPQMPPMPFPGFPGFPSFPGMPPGMPGMPPGMPGMPPGMPPGWPPMFGPPPTMPPNREDRRRRSRSRSRDRRNYRRRSRSRDRRSRSRDRRSRSRERYRSDRRDRGRGRGSKSASKDRDASRDRSEKTKTRSQSRDDSRSPERKQRKQRSRSRDRRSSDDDKRVKKEKKRKKSRDPERRKSKKNKERRRSRSHADDDEQRQRSKRKRDPSETKEDSKRRSLGPANSSNTKPADKDDNEKDDAYVRKKLISEESTTSVTANEPPPLKSDDDNDERKTSQETDTEQRDEFSSSKWKPALEKKTSEMSSTNDTRDNEDMDVEMDDALELNAKPDELTLGLPDLRTVISRPSSVSDADTDDYKPNKMMKKAAKDAKKNKKRRDSLQDKHNRVVSYGGSSPESGKRAKSKKEKKEKKSKKSKKSRRHRSSSESSSPERVKTKFV